MPRCGIVEIVAIAHCRPLDKHEPAITAGTIGASGSVVVRKRDSNPRPPHYECDGAYSLEIPSRLHASIIL